MFIIFVTTLAGGLLGVLAMCRMQQVAWKFVRLIAILSLCLLVPVLASFGLWSGWQRGGTAVLAASLTAAAGMAGFVVLGLAPVARRYSTGVRGFAAAGGVLALGAARAWAADAALLPSAAGWERMLPAAAGVLMGLVLGAVSLATALGHAYLTHTAMTIHPLRRLAWVFAAAITARLLWALLIGGGLAWQAVAQGRLAAHSLTGEWLMLSVRGLLGLIIPTVFAYMVVETVRLRATQSATGILYFALVLVFIGELTSLYLLRELGIPF